MRQKNPPNTFKQIGQIGTFWGKQEVDAGWRKFWAKRGHVPPPPVSTYAHGCFILPNQENLKNENWKFSNS